MSPALAANPRPRAWSREEYYLMAELGWFRGQRAELVEGEVFVLSPQNFRHSSAVDRVFEVVKGFLGDRYWVRAQLPLQAGPLSEPEPDVSVVPGRREDYTDHPDRAELIVEVSDSTLAFDRGRKASLYASRGVREYWIGNLVDEQLEVFRRPHMDPSATGGAAYDPPQVCHRGESIAAEFEPSRPIGVADLLG
jgi:Uma2 family endonuclease